MKTEQDDCIDCQWCCRKQNNPIPGGLEYAFLYYIKGRPIYWEPITGEWYTLTDSPCQHITPFGCAIYEDRPRLCREWYCPFGPEWIEHRYEILLAAGQRIMKQIERRGNFA